MSERANPKLFVNESLNRTIIFKYPNFAQSGEGDHLAAVGGRDAGGGFRRPIETAIFAPYDPAMPAGGGHGIYLRQKNFKELMIRHLGFDVDRATEQGQRDIKILEEIDRIPSLDPFLLKSPIQRIFPEVDERYLAISEAEAEATRGVIAAKVKPIIERALTAIPPAERARQTERFLAALWDSTLPEADLFISAFGIEKSNSAGIFEALKGVSYYQWSINAQRESLAKTVKWLQSPNSVPHDIRQYPHMRESVDMFRTQILKSIRQISRTTTEIFREYEIGHQTFLVEGNPQPFRKFLESANQRYWFLGYSAAALGQVTHLFTNAMRRSYKEQISLEQLNELLSLMQMAMASKSELS